MIVHTKLHIPNVRNAVVPRPRLIQKLNEGLQVKLTHLSAQAGYGKTTALSEWVKQCDRLVAWLSIDIQDNDGLQFWRYVTASIQARIPSFGSAVADLLERGSSVPLLSVIGVLLNELNDLTDELVIILDDYQFIELAAIHHSLSYLIERLPSHIHLYIASRNELAIPTARLLAKGECHQMMLQDLRFQLDEGVAFFRDMTDLSLTREQVTTLFDQTEGWISGLQLAAISLKRSTNITESIDRFSGQQHHISDYLLEEVLHHQSEPLLSFLMATSILSRMNQSLSQAVTGQLNSQQQLERLEQLNLFIIPLDDHRSWYRYHHLFSDFLQRIFAKQDPDSWVRAHIRAARWLEHQGMDEEAVEHYLAGEQYTDVVRLIEKNVQPLMQSKSIALHRWISALPENVFAEKPMLEMFYISVLLGVGEWDAAYRRVEHAVLQFQGKQGVWNDEEWKRAMGNISFFRAAAAYLQKDLTRASEYLELVEQYMPEGSYFQTMGRNRYQGYDLFDDYLATINDLRAADAFLLKWIAVWGSKENYPFVGLLYASYSKLLYEWNRLEEAERYASQALERKDMQPFARILIPVAISASRIQQAQGHAERASELLTSLKSQIVSPDYEWFMLKIEAEQACLSMQQGAIHEALAWLQSCGMAPTDEVALSHVFEYLALASVLAGCGLMEQALELLERMNELLSKEDRRRDQIKVLILLSMTHHRLGQTDPAMAYLEKALHLAEPEGYIRSFVDEGLLMAELLSAYMKKQEGSAWRYDAPVSMSYVRQLLRAMPSAAEAELSIEDLLTEQEMRVLQLIAEGLSNKEMALRLSITGETVKFHIKNVYRKLDVSNRVQALQRARASLPLA